MPSIRQFVIDSLKSVTEKLMLKDVTWSELVSLRDSKKLVKGTQYRITDYNCTTAQEDTQSAGHQFDIIVVADDDHTLNENARAVKHAGDTYFSGATLEAWEIKYSLDNDDKRFYWAVTGATGRGVIYYMKDEWNNECPYDFKNIQFKRKLTDGQYDDTGGVETFVYTFNAYDLDNETINDASNMVGRDAIDDGTQYCFSNTIKPTYRIYASNIGICLLNDIVFLNLFSLRDNRYFESYFNIFGNSCNSNTFGNYCISNTFGNYCGGNIFGNYCGDNTFGNYCNSNTFGNICSDNTFGNYCGGNTFGNSCNSNTFGNICLQIIFNKDYVCNVIIENGNQNITLTSTQTPTEALLLRNITIAQGVNNSFTMKTISHNTLNDEFKTTYQSANSQVINI